MSVRVVLVKQAGKVSTNIPVLWVKSNLIWFNKCTPISLRNEFEKRMNGYLKVNSILKVNSTYVNYTDSSESGLTVFMVMKDRDNFHSITSMLVSDIGDQICWWQVWDVGDRFRILMTNFIHWKITNIMILPPTSDISRHHKVTNTTVILSPRIKWLGMTANWCFGCKWLSYPK